MSSFKRFLHIGMALDPIHVGSGGSRIGRVDLSIVREPATRVPKIPGSSLAGVYRAYVAMVETEANPQRKVDGQIWPYYPHCAGQGQARDRYLGHCGQPDCPVCVVFGFARGKDQGGGFAGLAGFTDAHVLLFPVPTRKGPYWVTCPMALRLVGLNRDDFKDDAVYLEQDSEQKLNLGWLYLDVRRYDNFRCIKEKLHSLGIPDCMQEHLAILPNNLFSHVVNSNLEVRTSVSINPETGAAEEGALFSYEALPRATVLVWEVIAKNPAHFKIAGQEINLKVNDAKEGTKKVHEIVKKAHPYLEYLGIGGMGTRGMGRLKVIYDRECDYQRQE